jgi:ubiquinone/menaquinone biosynthesis C-methylase UbiE
MTEIRASSHFRNKAVHRSPDTVPEDELGASLPPGELQIFDLYVPFGAAILDIGVGCGRTTPYLSQKARRYLAIDCSEEAISACRHRFPDKDFSVMDVSDMAEIPDRSFDVVVFSKGIGFLHPDSARLKCLMEIARVLKPSGIFIFSSHNSRSLLERPRQAGASGNLAGTLKSLTANFQTVGRRLAGRAFWTGSGYTSMESPKGLTVFASTPRKVMREVEHVGFISVALRTADYPRADSRYTTPSYYYVFRNADGN